MPRATEQNKPDVQPIHMGHTLTAEVNRAAEQQTHQGSRWLGDVLYDKTRSASVAFVCEQQTRHTVSNIRTRNKGVGVRWP